MHNKKQIQSNYKVLFICFLVLLVWLPWPLGGNRPWAWPIMSAMIFTLNSILLFILLRKREPLPKVVIDSRLALIFMSLWLVYLVVQIIPLPPFLLEHFSPAAADAYNGLNTSISWFSISVDRAATFTGFIKALSYIGLLFLALVTVNSKERLKKTIWAIVFTAILQTIYGSLSIGEIDAFIKANHNTLQGSYPNRNHYAGFMEMALALGVGLFMTRYFKVREVLAQKTITQTFITIATSSHGLILLSIAIIFSGLLLSESRGAFLSFSSSFTIIFIFALLKKNSNFKRKRLFVLPLTVVIVTAISFNSLEVVTRLIEGGVSGREFVWKPAIVMAKEYLVFGSGLGSFQSVFPSFYPTHGQTWWHAHMNYLQLFIELGLVGFVLFAGGTITVLYKVTKSFLKRRDPFFLGVSMGVLMGMLSILVHELVEYHYYIPANAAYFYVLMAIGLISSSLETRK